MEKFKTEILMALGISLAIIIGITLFTVDNNTWSALNKINLSYLAVILVVTVLVWSLNGLKLKVLASGVGFKLPLLTAIELGLVDRFFSNITPSGIGGQPVKIIALTKCDITSGKASAIVIVELILRLLFFILSLPFIFLKLHELFLSYVSTELLVISLPSLLLGLGVIIYLLLYKPRYIVRSFFWLLNRSLVAKVTSKQQRFSWKRSFAREIRVFYQTIWIYLKEGLFQLVTGLILTAGLWLARFTILYFVILGFNLEVDLGYLFLLQLLIYTVVLFIPVPGGSGVEVILASLLRQVVPVSLLGIIVASWRFFTYYTYIIVGGLVTFKVFQLGQDVELAKDH